MDNKFTNSPSHSPAQLIYPRGHQFESTPESSGPDSPHATNQITLNSNPMQFEMYQYSGRSSSFYPSQPTRVSVEYTSPVTLDGRDRRRRRSASSSTCKEKEDTQNMHLRRRAQNRASQRAFRERKEQHVKGLENQLEDLHDKHHDLLQSYKKQSDELTSLHARIQDLNAELDRVRAGIPEQPLLTPPDRFDDYPDAPDMLYTGPEFYFDKNAVDQLNSEFPLPFFENSL